MTMLELRQNDPRGKDTQNGHAKVEPNTSKVICIALGLHTASVSICLIHIEIFTYAQATVCPRASNPLKIPQW